MRDLRKFARPKAFAIAVVAATVLPYAHSNAAYAQGVPTVDTQNIAQSIRQLQNMLEDAGLQNAQLDQLLSQVTLLQGHLETANNLYASLTGARDIVGLTMDGDLNDLLEGNMSGVLGTILAGMNGDWSGLTGPRSVNMRTTMTAALESAGFGKGTVEELAGTSVPGARRVASAATGGAVVAAAGESAHANTAQSLGRVGALVDMIGETEDLKASIDLNTRVNAEVVIALSQLIELEAVTAVNSGMAGMMDAATMAEERAFLTFGNIE